MTVLLHHFPESEGSLQSPENARQDLPPLATGFRSSVEAGASGVGERDRLRDHDTHPEQFEDLSLGRLPREWSVAPLEAVQSSERPYIKTGSFGSTLKGEHRIEEGTPVITIGALGEGTFLQDELLYISEDKARTLAAYSVTPGDLVFSRVADVGRSVVVGKSQHDWIISSNLMRISLDCSKAMPKFAHLNLVHSEYTREQVRRSVNAGGREIANTAILRGLRFAWPPIEEQHRIVEILDAHDARIRAEEAYHDKLKLQKKGFMEDLLTGRVRVKTAQEVEA